MQSSLKSSSCPEVDGGTALHVRHETTREVFVPSIAGFNKSKREPGAHFPGDPRHPASSRSLISSSPPAAHRSPPQLLRLQLPRGNPKSGELFCRLTYLKIKPSFIVFFSSSVPAFSALFTPLFSPLL